MDHKNQDHQKMSFSKQGAWLGLLAYFVLFAIVASIYIFG